MIKTRFPLVLYVTNLNGGSNPSLEDKMISSKIWNADLGNGYYKNPILYTDYSDPDAIRVGDDYFMIASSFCNVPGIPLLHSKDLVNWEIINYIIDEIPEERYKAPIHGCGVWAPSIRYHEGTYYVCFPMPDEGIYMSTTANPFGKWSKPINIRPGAGWIDPCPFWDDDGKAYLVAGVAKSRIGYKSVLHMVEMNPDGLSLIGDEIKIFDGNENDQVTIEGPKMYKRNGWYYIFAPAGGVKTGWQTVLRSRNVYGPYEYKVVMRQGDTEINGPHQGAWVDTITGEDWFIHFQDVYGAGRITHLQPMSWKNDWPIIGMPKGDNNYGEPVLKYKKPNIGNIRWKICEPETSDDFTVQTLGLQWQWNANPQKDWYKLTGKNLRLNAIYKNLVREDTPYGDIPNLLLQKWHAPEFTCITKLDLSNLNENDEAGVISMGMSYCLLTFKKENEILTPCFITGIQKYGRILTDHTEENLKELPRLAAQDGKNMFVKYIVTRTGTRDLSDTEKNFPVETVEISYSIDGTNYIKAGEMESVPGRWVGVKNGVFCVSLNKQSNGYATIDYVDYETRN
jgi:beta-xylosidase